MSGFKTIDQLEVAGRRVLLRVDLNVPMADGRVTDSTRIDRILPTIRDLTGRGARVVLLSHYGRPKGKPVAEMSLAPLVEPLSAALGGQAVAFAPDCIGPAAEAAVAALGDGEVLLLENLRFHPGEEANDPAFAEALARLGDLTVNDAFSAAHRAHASVEALPRRLPAAAGRLMQDELEHLALALEAPARPVMAIVGGAKISTKLDLLGNLIRKVDVLVVGGGMANTFLNALGVSVGASLCESDMAATAREIVAAAKDAGCDIVLPSDAVVAEELAEGAATETLSVKQIPAERMILDLGPLTADHIARRMAECRTLVWNGPLGCFEVPPFDQATNRVAQAAADLTRER
ncbi:MAG: phosphoglycerate kinase, partial [Kiloniellales bacterium]|nr:phosphoglycerate kinase [Kiloniellales bacterium]